MNPAHGNTAAKAAGELVAVRHAIRRDAGPLTFRRPDHARHVHVARPLCGGCGMDAGTFDTRRAFTAHRAVCEAS